MFGSFAKGNEIEAEVHTPGFQLGKLTGREEQFGETAFDLSGKGLLRSGAIPSFRFKEPSVACLITITITTTSQSTWITEKEDSPAM